MPDGEELGELHVHELRPGAERERVALSGHVGRRAVPPVEAGEAARRDHHGAGRDSDGGSVLQAEPGRAHDDPVVRHQVRHHEPARPGDAGGASALAAEALRDGGAGAEEVDVDAARHPVPGGGHLAHPAVRIARPPDLPLVHLADALDRALAEEGGEALIDEAAAGLEGVGEVPGPVVRPLLGDGGRDRHLGHDRGAAPSDHALVGEEHPGARPGGGDGGVHAGPARPDHEHIRLQDDHQFRFPSCSDLSPRR